MNVEFRISRYLLVIAIVLIALGVLNAWFVSREIRTFRRDEIVINNLGIIRGSIQRVSKRELVNMRSDSLICDIDSLLRDFMGKRGDLALVGREEKLTGQIQLLSERWSIVKQVIKSYRAAPEGPDRTLLIQESENCWILANDLVLTARIESEAQLRHLYVVFYIIGLNLTVLLFIIWLNRTFIRNRLEFFASFDALTGVLNRHSYARIIKHETMRSRRYGHPLSLLMIDIDLFKKVNDRYGHRKGDIVLRRIADTIVGVIRESESLCRIGGEEFMAVAPETSLENALALGERLRAAVESIAWEESIHVTVSIGVTEFRSEDTVDSFQRRADSALYAAKRNGRNRVETVSQDA